MGPPPIHTIDVFRSFVNAPPSVRLEALVPIAQTVILFPTAVKQFLSIILFTLFVRGGHLLQIFLSYLLYSVQLQWQPKRLLLRVVHSLKS